MFARANRCFWDAGTTFHCAACGLQSAAGDLGFDVLAVDLALAAVGVECMLCNVVAD